MMNGSLVAQVGFDVVWMNIGDVSVCCFVLDCWGLSSTVAKLQWWNNEPKMIVLFLVLCIFLYIFKSC
jgi:hypothetical protein